MGSVTGRLPFLLATVFLASALSIPPAIGQAPPPAPAPARFDPPEVYFQGWLLTRDAEKLVEAGKFTESLEKLRRAQQFFDTVARTFPELKKEMVAGRRKKTFDNIAHPPTPSNEANMTPWKKSNLLTVTLNASS